MHCPKGDAVPVPKKDIKTQSLHVMAVMCWSIDTKPRPFNFESYCLPRTAGFPSLTLFSMAIVCLELLHETAL